MNIVVCVKQVPDPETPASQFRVDEPAKKVIPAQGVPLVISQFDAIAVEAALRIRDAQGEGKITIISMGLEAARDVVKHGLAMGGDDGILLCDPAFDDSDSYTTAFVLSEAIKKVGDCDLILCGRQSTDWDFGVVGAGIAQLLGLPAVTIARKVEAAGSGKLRVERTLLDGFETVEVTTPCVVTISNELGEPRYPQLRQIMVAARKQVTIWKPADLGLDSAQVGKQGARLSLERLFVPVVESRCEFIGGESPEEMAANLARRLRDAKLI